MVLLAEIGIQPTTCNQQQISRHAEDAISYSLSRGRCPRCKSRLLRLAQQILPVRVRQVTADTRILHSINPYLPHNPQQRYSVLTK